MKTVYTLCIHFVAFMNEERPRRKTACVFLCSFVFALTGAEFAVPTVKNPIMRKGRSGFPPLP